MRQRSGCKACRDRHVKCVKLRDSEKCKQCYDRKRPCIRGETYRFRPVTSVKFNAGEDVGSAEQELAFAGNQTWVHIPACLRFVPPNTDDDDELPDEPEPEPAESEDSAVAFQERTPAAELGFFPLKDLPFQGLRRTDSDASEPFPALHKTRSGTSHAFSDSASIHEFQGAETTPNTHTTHELPTVLDSPSVQVPLLPPINDVLNNNNISPPQDLNINSISPFGSSNTFSPNFTLPPRWPLNSSHEAELFHHFIVHCTPWIDVCDPRCHWGKEVPKRAAHFPVILNGILGLAARHQWLLSKVQVDESQQYIDKCLEAIIVALEDPLAHWDENFLIAVILLRLHEEMGDSDEQCHHLGTARILNSISSFAADGGLRESASWVSLRQHIYISLTTQAPLSINLDNYKHSSAFRDFDDEAWANRVIFIFATILQELFREENTALSKERWQELDNEVEEWERTKPWTFTALYTEEDAGKEFHGSWPSLPCPAGVVAVGLQYYHLCKILLLVYDPSTSLVGLAGLRARKTTDMLIRQHIRIIIGYGISNSHCGNAMFQGSHILAACGAYVTDKNEQEKCFEYLRGIQNINGWRTDAVVADLKEQWRS